MKFYSKSVENPFGSPIGSILASFGLPRAFPDPFRLLMPPLRFHLSPFGSRLGPFCLHFWCILAPFWVFVGARGGYPFYCPFISISVAVFGSILGQFWRPKPLFFLWKIVSFFQSIFYGFLLSFWEVICTQIASKIASETKKSISWKWASRAGESSIFKVRGPQHPCKRPPKID